MKTIKYALPIIAFALSLTSCCEKCDSEFIAAENELMIYQGGEQISFQSNLQGQATFRAGQVDKRLNAKKCSNIFGGEGSCIIRQSISFSRLEGEIAQIDIELRKVDGQPDLEITVDNQFLTLRDSQLMPGSGGQAMALSIGGVTYDDVYERVFDPNTACKFPEECVDIGDVVAIRYSLTAGILQFEVHKGLQEPNEVYTIN